MNAPDAAAATMFDAAPDAVEGGEPVGQIDLATLLESVAKVVRRTRSPRRRLGRLAGDVGRAVIGTSDIEVPANDWRFADQAWRDNVAYHRLAQAYLTFHQTVHGVVDDADVDWRTAERARFALNIVTTAVAPTNNLLTNPAALKHALDTGGRSLARGARNFAHDVRHNGGMPSQADTSGFTVGGNLAVTPGAVVHRSEICEIIHYQPTTPTVSRRPLLVVPPQINRYYFLDLAPGRSFVEYAVSEGLQVFLISWRNPGPEHADWNLDDYAGAVLAAVDIARDITNTNDVNLLGFCAGGILSAAVLSYLAATDDDRIHSASFAVTLLDFDTPAMIGLLGSPRLLSVGRSGSRRRGVLEGRSLASVFSWFRPNDLVWNYWVNNYLMGKQPPAFDILAWNSDTTNLPAALHGQFLDLFERNVMCSPGALTVLGEPVDLSRIKLDTYVTGAVKDHLTPWKGCYRTTQLISGSTTFVLSYAGHIQALVNPPSNPKAHYFLGDEPGPDPDKWLAGAERHDGSWWEHWAAWALQRSGDTRTAPRRLGNRRHPPLEPAPGTYVRQ